MKRWFAKLATMIFVLAATAAIAMGQSDNSLLRTVRGTVVDMQGRALASSVVFLHDQSTHAVRTQIVDSNGQYRFSGMNPHVDYKIHAEHGDWTSSVRSLSARHSKRDVVLDFKVDKRKKSMSSPNDSSSSGNIQQPTAGSLIEAGRLNELNNSLQPRC